MMGSQTVLRWHTAISNISYRLENVMENVSFKVIGKVEGNHLFSNLFFFFFFFFFGRDPTVVTLIRLTPHVPLTHFDFL
jgi:hypothetical protein